jgi:hypothetical protein
VVFNPNRSNTRIVLLHVREKVILLLSTIPRELH